MFLKYLKRKSFIHLFAFYIFKFLKRKSFTHLFTFHAFFVCLNFFIKKKKFWNSPNSLIYTTTQTYIFFGFTKIRDDSKWTKRSWNELMQPTTSNSHSRSIFPDDVYNQAGFNNPFINGRAFIYWDVSQLSFSF